MEEIFAVIDTETNWSDEVMSIGVTAARSMDFCSLGTRYYILLPYKERGGMYSDALYVSGLRPDMECGRDEALTDLIGFLENNGVRKIFAYNALFDRGHLPELRRFGWYDIMKIAAYRQYNKSIPAGADCYSTGRLKRGYGVESVYRTLSGDRSYRETHNALYDAADELAIMKMLGVGFDGFSAAKL